VPFSLLGGSAHGTGRGELLHAIPDPTTWWWVVVPSPDGLATPSVYRRFDDMFPDAPATPASSAGTLAALAAGDPDRLAAALHNDLEAPAIDLRPALGDLIAHGEAEGALRGIVSGSGPTVAFLCWSGDHARSLADTLQGDDLPVVLVANGPVAGAHVLP
jgi:4-diphosphocytidyl-2-C-methyl-D-erythritol kinase